MTEYLESVQAYQEVFRTHSHKIIFDFAVELKSKYPEMGGFIWLQYQPGYNDQDTPAYTTTEAFLFNTKEWALWKANKFEEYFEWHEPKGCLGSSFWDFQGGNGEDWSDHAVLDISKYLLDPMADLLTEIYGANRRILVDGTGELTIQKYEVGY